MAGTGHSHPDFEATSLGDRSDQAHDAFKRLTDASAELKEGADYPSDV
jgi:hypothetical protein